MGSPPPPAPDLRRGQTASRRVLGIVAIGLLAVLGAVAFMAAAIDTSGDGSPEVAASAAVTAGAVASPSPSLPSPSPGPTGSPSPSAVLSVPPPDRVVTTSPSPVSPTAAAADGASGSPNPGGATLPDGDATTVERIVDGDTLYLTGLAERVRLIGIDTPETVAPNTPVECFGPEATAHLGSLVPPGTEVVVTWDVERIDRFGRPLVYLHRASDGLFVNERMLVDGFAQMVTHPPNVARVDTFRAAQAAAREAGRGLWSADCGDDTERAAPAAPATSGATGAVVIADIAHDGPGADVEYNTSEHVVLRNGGDDPVDVGGWSLTDLADHRITIPDGHTIDPGGELLVHTGPGDDSATAHHAGRTQAIWNNSGGDTAVLRDRAGTVIDEFSYDS